MKVKLGLLLRLLPQPLKGRLTKASRRQTKPLKMGAMLSCLALDAGFGMVSKTMSCICCILPWGKSTGARFLTALIYFFWSFIAYAVYFWMRPIPYPPITDIFCGVDCYKFYGVYRVVLGMALGYLGLSVSLLGVTDSRSPRALIQDGFWPLKMAGFAGIIALLFYGGPRWLLDAAFVPSCILSALFLLAQSILLVDFSYDVADWLLEQAEQVYEGFNWYGALLVGMTVCAQFFNIGSAIYLWIKFPADRSRLTTMANFVFTILMTICSLLESVREANPNAGIFQSSVLGSYVMFLLLTAIVGDPEMHPSSNISGTVGYAAATATLLSVAYSAYSTGGSGHKLVSSSAGLPTTADDVREVDADGEEITEYNYALYQFVFVCAALYTGLLITGWKRPVVNDATFALVDVKLTFWIKVGTSWIISALYIWSLFAPLILTHREFY